MAGPSQPIRFPNEGADYRARRNALLDAERALRVQLEQVAAMRRSLPLGGQVQEDYVFEEGAADLAGTGAAKPVRLSELFREGTDSLILYSFMFGPDMKQACASCTSILDGLDGNAPHVQQRTNLAVVAKSPLDRIRQFARGRGWRNLRLLSSAKNTYNAAYHGETADGKQMPALNVFVRRDGRIHHTYGTELLYASTEPGQDGRHVDLIWPLWNLFDLTPEGRGATWNPRLTYDPVADGRR
jgi:predicted dithiol-disulfide oxidoreductase (DUF899 family)